MHFGRCKRHYVRATGESQLQCFVTNALSAFGREVVDEVYGVAVDVGSTTIAAHLCSLRTGDVLASSGVMNPQIRFGEDLMSRVSYVMMHPGSRKQI